MTCLNENCIWRNNGTQNVWHCDYSYTCPRKTDKNAKYTVSDHTEACDSKISFSNKTNLKNADTKAGKI